MTKCEKIQAGFNVFDKHRISYPELTAYQSLRFAVEDTFQIDDKEKSSYVRDQVLDYLSMLWVNCENADLSYLDRLACIVVAAIFLGHAYYLDSSQEDNFYNAASCMGVIDKDSAIRNLKVYFK